MTPATMKTMFRSMMFLALATTAVVTTACKDDKKADAPGSGKAKEGGGGGGKPTATTIEAFGLVFDGPADAKVDEMMDMQMIQAPGLVFSVDDQASHTDKTLETAIEDSKMYDGSTITKQETTADGYHLEFNNKGSMGANYFIEVMRTIGGKKYLCSTTAPEASIAAAAVKACLSLRAK